MGLQPLALPRDAASQVEKWLGVAVARADDVCMWCKWACASDSAMIVRCLSKLGPLHWSDTMSLRGLITFGAHIPRPRVHILERGD